MTRPLLPHHPEGCLGDQERSTQVHRNDSIPLRYAHLVHRNHIIGSRTVDGHIQAPEVRGRLFDRSKDGICVAHITRQVEAVDIAIGEVMPNPRGCFRVQVDAGHGAAGLAKRMCRSFAQAAACSRNQCNFALEIHLHVHDS
jgi:hypothetical protein